MGRDRCPRRRALLATLLGVALAAGCVPPRGGGAQLLLRDAAASVPLAREGDVDAVLAETGTGRAVLRLDGVGYDGPNPGTAYAVYVHPAGAAPDAASYVGNLSFFGTEGRRGRVELDATPALRALGGAARARPLRATFQPVATDGPAAPAAARPLARVRRVTLVAVRDRSP